MIKTILLTLIIFSFSSFAEGDKEAQVKKEIKNLTPIDISFPGDDCQPGYDSNGTLIITCRTVLEFLKEDFCPKILSQ